MDASTGFLFRGKLSPEKFVVSSQVGGNWIVNGHDYWACDCDFDMQMRLSRQREQISLDGTVLRRFGLPPHNLSRTYVLLQDWWNSWKPSGLMLVL